MTTPVYIFDLDGTLALIEHRLHFITRPAISEGEEAMTPEENYWRNT